MNTVRQLLRRLLSVTRRGKLEREMEDEMRFHLEMQIEQNLDAGMSSEEARWAARRQFGNQTWLKEVSREMWSLSFIEKLIQDLRYGARMLLRKPGFTLIAVITLTLGVGANTAIFSVAQAVLLRPLPYDQPERLVSLWETDMRRGGRISFSAANFIDWRAQNQVCSQMAAFVPVSVNLTGRDEPERISGLAASANLFQLLGAQAELGRVFLTDEDEPGAAPVVVLSYGLWRRRFGADPQIVGQTLTLDGVSRTVIGVMPPGFQFPLPNMTRGHGEVTGGAEAWLPLVFNPAGLNRSNHNHAGVARLKPGVTLQQAQAEMDAISRRLELQYPDTNTNLGIRLVPLHEQVVGDMRSSLLVLFGAVGFVLLIACVNVANLLLARAAARRKEIAIRAALGAGRGRLIGQLLTESLMLAIGGGGLGFLLGLWGVDALIAVVPAGMYGVERISLNAWVLGFTFAVSILTGLLFGLAPALQASKPDLNVSLNEGSRSVADSLRRHRFRSLLVVSEVALALMLLVGAGLMIKSFLRLQRVDMGFRRENVMTANLALPAAKYREQRQWAAFYKQTLERAAALPGVQFAGIVSHLPLSGVDARFSLAIEGRPQSPTEQAPAARIRAASPDYFRAMGISLLAGRQFTDGDTEDKPRALIINEEMARQYWPGEDPLGKRITFDEDKRAEDATWPQVAGVVKGVRHSDLQTGPGPQMYVPYQQLCTSFMSLVIRAEADPVALTAALRNVVREVDKDQPLYNVRTMEQLASDSVARPRFTTLALAIFAGVALLLAAVGIYGVMSYLVTQRTREIGVRVALGARGVDVLKLVVGQGMLLASIGVVIGLIGAFALTRLMSGLLFGVSPTDPATFAFIALLLAGVALLACYLPVRRAMKVDPMIALRVE